jgi:GrpB-like predicted nucleotidyltransferase (UPF0157 family)
MSLVEVVSYNPEWKTWFEELREPIWEKVRYLTMDIVHVGSTSIEGMSAKPIIDIDIVMDDWEKFPELVERLASLGYRHVGDLGISGREAFNMDQPSQYRHHLYACKSDSTAYRNHMLLRKHLMENPEDFKRYNDLKIGLAGSVSLREDYWRSKTLMIMEFLEREGLSREELERIRADNLG